MTRTISPRSLLGAFLIVTLALQPIVVQAQVVPGGLISTPTAAASQPYMTFGRFFGFQQGYRRFYDGTVNRNGNLPGLERKPPLKALADPENLLSKNPAIKKAAEIKFEEDLAMQKVKAIKYLAKIGCGCYPGVKEALLAALDDCTEFVRYEAVKAIAEAAVNKCEHCSKNCCCDEDLAKRLSELAYEKDDKCCWLEPSERVREGAREALCACCRGGRGDQPADPTMPIVPPAVGPETVPPMTPAPEIAPPKPKSDIPPPPPAVITPPKSASKPKAPVQPAAPTRETSSRQEPSRQDSVNVAKPETTKIAKQETPITIPFVGKLPTGLFQRIDTASKPAANQSQKVATAHDKTAPAVAAKSTSTANTAKPDAPAAKSLLSLAIPSAEQKARTQTSTAPQLAQPSSLDRSKLAIVDDSDSRPEARSHASATFARATPPAMTSTSAPSTRPATTSTTVATATASKASLGWSTVTDDKPVQRASTVSLVQPASVTGIKSQTASKVATTDTASLPNSSPAKSTAAADVLPSTPKTIPQGKINGTVTGVDNAAGTISLSFNGMLPEQGTQVQVFHHFLLGEECLGAVEIVEIHRNHVIARSATGLPKKIAIGDRAMFVNGSEAAVAPKPAATSDKVTTAPKSTTPAAKPASISTATAKAKPKAAIDTAIAMNTAAVKPIAKAPIKREITPSSSTIRR